MISKLFLLRYGSMMLSKGNTRFATLGGNGCSVVPQQRVRKRRDSTLTCSFWF